MRKKKEDSEGRAFPRFRKVGEVALSDGGITKREYYAAVAMHGLLSTRNGFMVDVGTESVGRWSVRCADSLILALKEKP